MKKLVIVALCIFAMVLTKESVQAGDYEAYQDISFQFKSVKLLDNYADSDYKTYYKKMKKTRFWGWRTFIVFDQETAYFTKETLYIIENDGTTPITETFSFNSEKTVKKQYGSSGSIGLKGSGGKSGFKLGLEQQLKSSMNLTTTSSFQEKISIKVLVDPQTKLLVQIRGEGLITNGVAKYYRFYKNVKKGGFEIFVVTTEYYSLKKVKLYED
jgi:hypothetical protein